MWLYSLFFVLIGISISFAPLVSVQNSHTNDKSDIMEASNYITYRNMVRNFAVNNVNYSGNNLALDMPETWIDYGLWDSRMDSKTAYAYGMASPAVEGAVMEKLNYPINTGVKQGSFLVTHYPDGNGTLVVDDIPLPSYISDGALVSVFVVNE